MRASFAVGILAFVIGVSTSARGNDLSSPSAQAAVDGLAASLVKDEVGRVEILQIPPRILTRTRVTPEMLEQSFYYKLTVADIRGADYKKGLVDAVKSLKSNPSKELADLRWAMIFYKVDGSRLASVYFDKSGRRGAINSAPTSFSGGLLGWVQETFGHCFR